MARGHGEGSIYRRKDGRWVAVITIEGNGRKYYYGDTRKEVQEKLKTVLHEQQQGILATGRQQKLGTYVTGWLENTHKLAVRESTYYQYKIVIERHIIPHLGHIMLRQLTPQHVALFYGKLLQSGLSDKRVRDIHKVLHRALDQAVEWNIVPRNVCDVVKPPRVAQQEMQALSPEQARRLLAATEEHRLSALFTLALITGMREGELLGLRWTDIDYQSKCLHVNRTVARIGNLGIKITEPKTARSRRRIALPDLILQVLQDHRRAQEAQRKDEQWNAEQWVFCNREGHVQDAGSLWHIWKGALEKAGLPREMHFHGLRHSAATILLSMGVPMKVVQEILGHSNISTTLGTYIHVMPGQQEQAMEHWTTILGEE